MKGYYKKFRFIAEIFLAASFMGWVYESVWYSMVENQIGFVNRGTLFGPWLIIYGIGILVIISILNGLKIRNGYLIFISATFLATVIELLGSYLQEALTGSFSWDYSDFFLNFQGRIALKPDIMFGLLSLYGMKQVVPAIEVLNDRYGDSKWHDLIFTVIFGLFILDTVISLGTGRAAQ